MDEDTLKQTYYSKTEHHGESKSPHDLVRVELGSFGFLPDPFQSLTLLKNPLLGFVDKVNQHLNAHTHTLKYMQVHTCIYTVYMQVYVYVSPYICGFWSPSYPTAFWFNPAVYY